MRSRRRRRCEGAPAVLNVARRPPRSSCARRASGVLISGIGGKVTFATPVVRTRFGTAGESCADSIFFLQLDAMLKCALARVGDFGRVEVTCGLTEYFETTQIVATLPRTR